jgi:hypothetical protein
MNKTMEVKVIDYMNSTMSNIAYKMEKVTILRNNAKTYTVRNEEGMMYKVRK